MGEQDLRHEIDSDVFPASFGKSTGKVGVSAKPLLPFTRELVDVYEH